MENLDCNEIPKVELPCHAKPRTRQTGLRDKTMAEHRRTEVLWLDPMTAWECNE